MRDLFQVHSSRYRNPAQLPAGAVLVVGSGNSGCQIAEDLLRGGRRVYLAVSAHRRAPRRYRGRDCTWWQFALGEFDLTTDKRPARKAALKSADEYAQKNGLELPDEDLLHERLPDPKEVSAPILELDLRPAGVSSVIWANGFSYDFGWVNLPVFAEFGIPPRQEPIHQRGVTNVPGLYFIGLPWLSKLKSSLMAGTGEDAAFLAEHIAHR
jgi:putative flavoprotein involved in K+ transport